MQPPSCIILVIILSFSSQSVSLRPVQSRFKISSSKEAFEKKLSSTLLFAQQTSMQKSTPPTDSLDAVVQSNADNHRASSVVAKLLGTWGFLQVAFTLGNAIYRLFPVAVEPLVRNDLTPSQWGMLTIWVIFMLYVDSYKAFHLKVSPLVIKRAFLIAERSSIMKIILAGPYSMGMFGATKKRMIISWLTTLAVFVMVVLVKRLPYPYRSIVDAGVVVGLSGGLASMFGYFVRALFGVLPDIDPCIEPVEEKKHLH